MKTKVEKKTENDINYSFILKCLGALTAAALITAGIIAALASKVVVVGMASLAAQTMFAAAVVATPLAPIIGLLALIAVVCLVSCLFSDDSCITVHNTPNYGYGAGYGGSAFYTHIPAPPVFIGAGGPVHQHSHASGGNSHQHEHASSGHSHQHRHQ